MATRFRLVLPIPCFTSGDVVFAQWVQTNESYFAYVSALAVRGTHLFAGGRGDTNGVSYSTDGGSDWAVSADLGLPANAYINALAVLGSGLFAGTQGGIFLSANNGAKWAPVKAGLTNIDVSSFCVMDSDLFPGTCQTDTSGGGIFRSSNNGVSWTAASSGLGSASVLCFAVIDTELFAGTYGEGVFVSTNKGKTWTGLDLGLSTTHVNTFALFDTSLFAGTWGLGVWRRPLSQMITYVRVPSRSSVHSFVIQQNFPNPFNPNTIIGYQLPMSGHLTLKIYDVLGRVVATLVDGQKPVGSYRGGLMAHGALVEYTSTGCKQVISRRL